VSKKGYWFDRIYQIKEEAIIINIPATMEEM
jgi:hypothetical protein